MHILDVISYQGSNDVLVYRSPKTDFTNYSRLIVHESQVAYVYLDGKMTGPYGPGDHTMDTGNIPILEKIVKIPYGGEAPFKGYTEPCSCAGSDLRYDAGHRCKWYYGLANQKSLSGYAENRGHREPAYCRPVLGLFP